MDLFYSITWQILHVSLYNQMARQNQMARALPIGKGRAAAWLKLRQPKRRAIIALTSIFLFSLSRFLYSCILSCCVISVVSVSQACECVHSTLPLVYDFNMQQQQQLNQHAGNVVLLNNMPLSFVPIAKLSSPLPPT